jgi:hypothetical protein
MTEEPQTETPVFLILPAFRILSSDKRTYFRIPLTFAGYCMYQ